MAVSPIPQAPFRQDRKVFLTPIIGDVLFSEVRDCSRISIPEYGTPHPDAKKWPSHKLVFVKTVDIERDGLFEFFYAAAREDQDLYNFSFGTRNVVGGAGGREFRIVLREYVTFRSEFDPLYDGFNQPMPNVPEGTFDGVEYVFFEKLQKKIDQPELDSLFVAETVTYIEKAFLDLKISYEAQRADTVPEKFRATIPNIITEGLVEGLVEIPTLAQNELQESQSQLNPDVKLVRNVTRNPQTAPVTLTGTRAYVEGTEGIVEESYSPTELSADTGLLVAQSVATPLGDGSFVKETVRVEEWPQLKSSEWDYELNTAVTRTEQFVAPPTNLNQPNTSFRAVNKDRTLQITETPPVSALLSYLAAFPTEVNLNLPNVLRKVQVVWSSDTAQGSSDSEWQGVVVGESGSLSGSEDGDAASSVSLRPELLIDIEQPSGSNLQGTAYFFYIETVNNVVTPAAFLDRLNTLCGAPVSRWPIFRPVSHTLLAQGAKATVRADASGSASVSYSENSQSVTSSTGKGSSYDVGLALSSVIIPPTIHPAIILQNAAPRTLVVSAVATAGWTGTNFPTVNVESNAQHIVGAAVTPTALPTTYPSAIPKSGLYVVQSRVEPYKWGWAKCSAIVMDANQLA